MFRITPSGLPADPYYPADLTKLGYFINDIDEIRSIANPTWYFKYFLTKNGRHNVRQREAMNTAIRDIIQSRMLFIGMNTHRLPFGAKEDEPHIPIWASKNIAETPRVVVLFGESFQDLGVFAQRIIGLHGGINAGSTIDFVRYIKAMEIDCDTGAPIPANQTASLHRKLENPEEIDLTDLTTDHPGIILANTGQLMWCRSLGKAITAVSWGALTRPSAVDEEIRFDPIKNTVKGHRTIPEHVGSVFTNVVSKLCKKDVKLDVIAIGDSCEFVPLWLDQNWDKVKRKMHAMAMVCPKFDEKDAYKNEQFKQFLLERTRGFVQDDLMGPGKAMFGPYGGAEAWQRGFGYNIYSIPSEAADEMVFPKHFPLVMEWMQKVAEGGEEYCEDELKHMTLDGEDGDEATESREPGLVGSDVWGTEEGELEMAARESEIEDAKKTHAERIKYEEEVAKEKARVEAELEKHWGKSATIQTSGSAEQHAEVEATTQNANAELPPSEDDKPEICTKSSVEDATKSLINDLQSLDIASQTALPATPQPQEPAPAAPATTTISSSTGHVTNARNAISPLPLTITSFDGTHESEYIACPPERMERLPSDVASTLSGVPEVQLSKEEKAKVLQTSVLSSPVKTRDDGQEEGERKISVVDLED